MSKTLKGKAKKKQPTIDELIEKAKSEIQSLQQEIKELQEDQDKVRGLFLKHDLYSDEIQFAKEELQSLEESLKELQEEKNKPTIIYSNFLYFSCLCTYI